MKLWASVVLTALAAGPVAAGDGPVVAVAASGGKHNGYDRIGAYVRLGPMWERDWGGWHADVRPEFELSRFRDKENDLGPKSLDLVSASGLLRAVYGQTAVRPYVELGLGGALLSRTRLGPKEFSTTFQFTERLGVGLEFGGRFSAGWRYAHYSNADIAKPNAGLDVHEIVLGMTF